MFQGIIIETYRVLAVLTTSLFPNLLSGSVGKNLCHVDE